MTQAVSPLHLRAPLPARPAMGSDHAARFERPEAARRAVTGPLAAPVHADLTQAALTRDADQAALRLRLERIERRLEISDG